MDEKFSKKEIIAFYIMGAIMFSLSAYTYNMERGILVNFRDSLLIGWTIYTLTRYGFIFKKGITRLFNNT